MIAKTALEIEVAETWATFLKRKTMLTGHPSFGLVLGGEGVPFGPLQGMLASLLYIDAVSIFDAATATQMTEAEHANLSTLNRRLKARDAAGKLLDGKACHRVRERRNNVAHEVIEATEAELNEAITVLHGQLQAWGVVGPPPAYGFHAERSGARASDKPGGSIAFDYEVGVKRGETWVLKYSFTKEIG
jgi:hypothetical protein